MDAVQAIFDASVWRTKCEIRDTKIVAKRYLKFAFYLLNFELLLLAPAMRQVVGERAKDKTAASRNEAQ